MTNDGNIIKEGINITQGIFNRVGARVSEFSCMMGGTSCGEVGTVSSGSDSRSAHILWSHPLGHSMREMCKGDELPTVGG